MMCDMDEERKVALTTLLKAGRVEKLRELAGSERKVGVYLSGVIDWLWSNRDTVVVGPDGKQQVVTSPTWADAPYGSGKTRPASDLIFSLYAERVDLLERAVCALHAMLCPDSALLQGENKPSITALVDELQGKYFER